MNIFQISMQDFYCQFGTNGSHKGFHIENRLVFKSDESSEEIPTATPKELSEEDRLNYMNANFDDLMGIKELPENEDKAILNHLLHKAARSNDEIHSFFKRKGDKPAKSEAIFGFFINTDGKYEIKGATPIEIEGNTLGQYLKDNLKNHVKTAGFKEVDSEDMTAKDLSNQVIEAVDTAKKHFDFLDKNYNSMEGLITDIGKVGTIRQFAEINHDYSEKKATLMAKSKISTEVLSFEVRIDLVKRNASNPTEAALLWYAINSQPALSRETKLDVYKIFDKKNITKNKIAIVNGRLVVPYKPKDKKLEDGVDYLYATYGYNTEKLNPALTKLVDPNNEFGGEEGKKIAGILKDGMEIYGSIVGRSSELIKSSESSEIFQANYELLQLIMIVPERMLNSKEELEADGVDMPDFTEENGPWFFGRADGKYYARNLHFVDHKEEICYVFDINKGWIKTDKFPTSEYAMPELYTLNKKGEWDINDEAIEMTYKLGLTPKEVLTRTLNVLHKTVQSRAKREALLRAFAENPPEGMAIPFPQLKDVEIILDEEHWADSITNLQTYLYKDYLQLFPGMENDTLRWMTKEISEWWMIEMKRSGKDTRQQPIDNEHKYKISSKGFVDNFADALLPTNINILYTAEKQFSDETQGRIDRIHEYIEGMYKGFFGKLTSILSSKFGIVGETISEIAEEYARQPLGDVWELSEELTVEWEALEKEKGEKIPFKKFMIVYGVKALVKLKDPEAVIEEDSFLGKLKKFLTGKSITKNPAMTATKEQAEQPRSPLDVTDKAQLQIFGSDLNALKYSFGQKRGQNIFTPDEIATMIVEAGDTKDTSFTNKEQNEFKIKKMKAKLNSLSGDEKTAFQTEYDYLVKGKTPAGYTTTETAVQAGTEEPKATEIKTGPGSSPNNAIDFNSINEGDSYNGWHQANSTITLKSGKLNIDNFDFKGKDSNGNPKTDYSIKIEIVYEGENESELNSENKKIDTYDSSQFTAMEKLLSENDNNLKIAQSSTRINKWNGNLTNKKDTIKEIRIYKGVKLKDPHLYKITD
ncbi:MAG: hypothetical protein Q8P68_05505 [Candidatus Peregrinibacteria bacterium]|nr:hypothetical protein [Candidatus Peregrinibacteria bacterium]MDZ4244353.1 hypothetical protein [Candidatus Gracilibacteria bacterium]